MINTKNAKLNAWVKMWADICQPENIYLCNGSDEELNKKWSENLKAYIERKLKLEENKK